MNEDLKQKIIRRRIEESETRIVKPVLPAITNHHNTMFGGMVMSMMDETAFVSATRFCRKAIVTARTEEIDFEQAIPAGSLVELVAKVVRVGNTSLDVKIDVYVEDMYKDGRKKAASALFVFVAIDKDSHQPIPVFDDSLK